MWLSLQPPSHPLHSNSNSWRMIVCTVYSIIAIPILSSVAARDDEGLAIPTPRRQGSSTTRPLLMYGICTFFNVSMYMYLRIFPQKHLYESFSTFKPHPSSYKDLSKLHILSSVSYRGRGGGDGPVSKFSDFCLVFHVVFRGIKKNC